MERLTKTYSDGTHRASDSLPCGRNSYDYKRLLIEKLGKYEDLEEQSRLIKLPCKYVWRIVNKKSPKYAFTIKSPITELAIYEIEDIDKENCKYFSTEEKAEARLKELRGGEMNEVRFRFHLSIMNLLSEKCNEHIAKADKILKELERYER